MMETTATERERVNSSREVTVGSRVLSLEFISPSKRDADGHGSLVSLSSGVMFTSVKNKLFLANSASFLW
ncbi:hypothetical protein RRG08_001462 [Elysia crispata]|uniref:Uncharacterized protein n=1 Tax=Elysia crispata TaxID=231223 RepID=A0AAE0ZQJ6_9GAST|nr:hypothetical protein RRG08_001462 [Elysia crispata]